MRKIEPEIFNYTETETHTTFKHLREDTSGEYKGIRITETYILPHHWGKKATTHYLIDLIFPMGTFECLNDGYYTPEGYGMPVFNKLEDAKAFIDDYRAKEK